MILICQSEGESEIRKSKSQVKRLEEVRRRTRSRKGKEDGGRNGVKYKVRQETAPCSDCGPEKEQDVREVIDCCRKNSLGS